MRIHQLLLMTAFGLGYLRPAPGTWGSLPPVIVALGLVYFSGDVEFGAIRLLTIDLPLAALSAIFTLMCFRWGSAAEMHFGRKDASPIVADEVAGQSIALLFLPWRDVDSAAGTKWNLLLALCAFIAFRLTDIIKPPPAKSLQRFQGGFGILIDDLIAGFYALILAQLAAKFIMPLLIA